MALSKVLAASVFTFTAIPVLAQTPYGSCSLRAEVYQRRYQQSMQASDLVCYRKSLERERRCKAERELDRVQRDLAAVRQEQALLRREAAYALTGEDPALIEQERKLGEAIRQYTNEKIQIEHRTTPCY